MNDVLNKDEIHDLLGKGKENQSADLKHYDFTENVGIVKEKFNKLELIYDKFVRTTKVSLYNFFKRNVDIESKAIKIYKANDYLSSIPVPTNINIINLPPLNGSAFFCIDSGFIFSSVEIYFGGSSLSNRSAEQNSFTPTELRITQNLINIFFQELQSAWEETYPIKFQIVGRETDPNMLTMISPYDVMVVKHFNLTIDGHGGDIHLALPLSVIDPIKEKLEFNPTQLEKIEDKFWETALRKEILEAPVELNCILATKRIKLGDIKKFAVGDIIAIDIPALSQVKIGNIPVYTTKFGTHDGHYAVKIHSKIK